MDDPLGAAPSRRNRARAMAELLVGIAATRETALRRSMSARRGRAGLSDYSFCLTSLPAMNGLHGWARIGPLVFHTTSN